jgi:hypothetical protein
MSLTLRIAAAYNLLWGAWVVLFPHHFFDLAGMERLNHPMIWQGMGMVIGVYGLGYWWASRNPVLHWPVVAVGFMGKVFGPAGWLFYYLTEGANPHFAWMLLSNDLIWWIPFFLILRKAWLTHQWKQ